MPDFTAHDEQSLWITDSQDEQTLDELLRDCDQIHVPVFQRSYVWSKQQFKELSQDIQLVREQLEDSQFLGAVVSYERPRPREVVGRLKALAVVDGQQRLLTLHLYVMALVEILSRYDKEAGGEVVQEFLLLARRRGLDVNTRIVPAYDDRAQYRLLWDRLDSADVLHEVMTDNPPKPPVASGIADGPLVKQYLRMIKHLKSELPRDADEAQRYLLDTLQIVTGHLTFVHLKLNDVSAATKIFERLNFRGVRVGIVDLVRNDVFARSDQNPEEASRVYSEIWKPFENALGERAEGFFFPYCLIHNESTKQSELFGELRRIWKDQSTDDVVAHMRDYLEPYLCVAHAGEVEGYPKVSARVERLVRMRRPTVIYAFMMKLLHELTHGRLDEAQACELLDAQESFLVRRAIVGYEPTGLHALFKGLWDELDAKSAPAFTAAVKKRSTIQWPRDRAVREAVLERPLASSKIVRLLLQEYDASLPGDTAPSVPQIEHIMPQSYDSSGPWAAVFTRDEHSRLKDTWANLVPITPPLNASLQDVAYERKRDRYKRESMFGTPRKVAEDYDTWTPETLKRRAEVLADWTLERWPFNAE